MTVTLSIQLVIAKKKPEDVNADRNSKNQTVNRAHTVISAFQTVAHVNVIWKERTAFTVNPRTEYVRANRISPVTFVSVAPMDTMDQIACHANVTKLGH